MRRRSAASLTARLTPVGAAGDDPPCAVEIGIGELPPDDLDIRVLDFRAGCPEQSR
jgi:hypothetical protein